MRESEPPTLRQFKIPVVLLISAPEELISAVSEVALTAQVLVTECTAQDATDTAAQMHPLVLIMPEDVYQKDAANYEALARDIRALILRVKGDEELDELEEQLMDAMAKAEEKRPSWSDGLSG